MLGIMLFKLGKVDLALLIIILAIIAVAIGIYFLIPIINRKQYQQMRDNLAKREASFKSSALGQHKQEEKEEPKEE